MAEEIRYCPNNHPSDNLGRCNVETCTYCDPIVKKPTHRKEGLPLKSDKPVKRRK